ncbi:hypothetical protein KC19_9G046600 [Ceratodon purpureus]|uniref:Uncharacterized protein n=1 Tax=Ceratodon purpureus TaxID=3225 RepID=A0A8T0GQD1_CERPU|nr:hypothetical protein KC19_9G046600 [Ceratodon purpureus]
MHLTGLMTRVVPRSLVASEEDANTLKRLGANPDGLQCVKLGVLQGRMLIVNSNPHSIMWLLLPCGGQVFMSRAHLSKEFMSSELLEWLAYALDGRGREVPRIGLSFCNEYVLVYSWLVEEALIERMVIFNVAEEQSWEKVEMPTGRTGFPLVVKQRLQGF